MRSHEHYENHFTWAAELLDAAAADPQSELRDHFVARAQVHATLALAAATRANGVVTVREDRPVEPATPNGDMTLGGVRMRDND
jgi:hypothetical protein